MSDRGPATLEQIAMTEIIGAALGQFVVIYEPSYGSRLEITGPVSLEEAKVLRDKLSVIMPATIKSLQHVEAAHAWIERNNP